MAGVHTLAAGPTLTSHKSDSAFTVAYLLCWASLAPGIHLASLVLACLGLLLAPTFLSCPLFSEYLLGLLPFFPLAGTPATSLPAPWTSLDPWALQLGCCLYTIPQLCPAPGSLSLPWWLNFPCLILIRASQAQVPLPSDHNRLINLYTQALQPSQETRDSLISIFTLSPYLYFILIFFFSLVSSCFSCPRPASSMERTESLINSRTGMSPTATMRGVCSWADSLPMTGLGAWRRIQSQWRKVPWEIWFQSQFSLGVFCASLAWVFLPRVLRTVLLQPALWSSYEGSRSLGWEVHNFYAILHNHTAEVSRVKLVR